MSDFSWNPSFDIGVNAMNDEHRKLLSLMDSLYQLHVRKASRAELGHALNTLAAFTKQHFQHEEKYMASINYPRLDSHRQVHADLLSKLAAHAKEFASVGHFADEFFVFLKLWLSAHIQGIDKKYGDHSKRSAA